MSLSDNLNTLPLTRQSSWNGPQATQGSTYIEDTTLYDDYEGNADKLDSIPTVQSLEANENNHPNTSDKKRKATEEEEMQYISREKRAKFKEEAKCPHSTVTLIEHIVESQESQTSTLAGTSNESSSDNSVPTLVIQPASPLKSYEPAVPVITSAASVLNSALSGSPEIVAFDDRINRIFEKLRTPLGVQWELARLVSIGALRYNQISEDHIQDLGTTNAQAVPAISTMIRKIPSNSIGELRDLLEQDRKAKDPWDALDKEAGASREARLGIAPEEPGYYGGRVEFAAKLSINELGKCKIELDMPTLAPSNRLRRMFGSAHFVQVRLKMKNVNPLPKPVESALLQPLVINNRVYRLLRRKTGDNKVLFICTNETWDGKAIIVKERPDLYSWDHIVAQLNPPKLNKDQADAKWAARFDILTSDSVPLPCRIKPENILAIDDIYAYCFTPGAGKAPAEVTLTDGAGFANRAVFQHASMYHRDGANGRLCAIQVRIGGAKGLLVLHPDPTENDNPEPRIWLRSSQRKIAFPPHIQEDAANCIVDLLRCAHMKDSCRIGSQFMINLSENAISPSEMHAVFLGMITTQYAELVNIYKVDGDANAYLRLRDYIARRTGVIAGRKARQSKGDARAYGLIFDSKREVWEEEEDDDGEGDDDAVHSVESTAWSRDPVSLLPSTLEETVVEFLDSGFQPAQNGVLRLKLIEVAKNDINSHYKPPKFYFTVPNSCYAMIIPDPLGILPPGQCYVHSSKGFQKVLPNGLIQHLNVVVGDVLVTRSPCMLPSDVQKVKAVDMAELSHYQDVIIFSVQEPVRSLASMLGGGDYDGDQAWVIFDDAIVSKFENSAMSHYADEPEDLATNFVSGVTKISHHLESSDPLRQLLQPCLLGTNYNPNLVGMYSKYHAYATYTLGYGHPFTKRLAYMFCKVLDGSKSGMLVEAAVQRQDQLQYGRTSPKWMGEEKKFSNEPSPKFHSNSSVFIMDKISARIKKERDAAIKAVQDYYAAEPGKDAVLLSPWADATKKAKLRVTRNPQSMAQKELGWMEEYVNECIAEHTKEVHKDFSKLPIEKRQDTLRQLSVKFHVSTFLRWVVDEKKEPLGILEWDNIAEIMASYLVHKSRPAKRTPYDMAFAILCSLKANSRRDLGGAQTVTLWSYEKMSVDRLYRQ